MFKLILKASVNSARVNQRNISASTGRRLGVFKDEVKPEEEDKQQTFDVNDFEEEDPVEREQRIEMIRNKSRLNTSHRNMLHNMLPYAESQSWVHETLKYKRKMYAKFGADSKIDPRICFWTKSELDEKEEYERVAFPKTVQEMMLINQQQKKEAREKILARDADVAKNIEKLEIWKRDINARKEKKETDARVAKERKDRLIDEVRRHFGYTIDPRDDRFKELLETKEREQRKAMKESKRQDKESKLMSKLMNEKKSKSDVATSDESSENNEEDDEKKSK